MHIGTTTRRDAFFEVYKALISQQQCRELAQEIILLYNKKEKNK